jgi:transaldolase
MANPWKQVTSLGQSLWYDNISRGFILSGGLQAMIAELDLRGVTSNPSIFEKAISKGSEYDEDIRTFADQGLSTSQIYERLTTDDIRLACDIFHDVYVATGRTDGYVSIEVDPRLAHTTDETLVQARHLWNVVDRPNVMIKIPGTAAGLPAITEAISEGINVNVTLLFGIENYGQVAYAYLDGLRKRASRGEDISAIRSVASFFLSRVDTNVDKLLAVEGSGRQDLLGKAAVANAKIAYARYKEIFYGPDFADLRKSGAWVQRCLWASVSTKNPAYRDVMYIEPLIGAETVTTVPDETISAFSDHGLAADTLSAGLDEAHRVIDSLRVIGIDTEEVARELQMDGVKKFEDAFNGLMTVLESKRREVEEAVS